MSTYFGFLPKAKQEVISEFGLDKAYINDRNNFIEDLLAFKDQLYSRGFTPEEINGIVIFVRGEYPKSGQARTVRVEDYPYGEEIGWKMHLYVKPQNYMFVDLWLQFNCTHGWKHLGGGDDQQKSFTIYTGSWNNTAKLARSLKDELDDKPLEPAQLNFWTELTLLGKISARFNSLLDYRGTQIFERYGYIGIPLNSRRYFELKNEPTKTDFEKRKKYWVGIFVKESLEILLKFFFNDPAKRRFFLGDKDVVLKVIENNLKILPH